MQVTDEGIVPMKTHKWIPHVVMQARIVPVETSPVTPRTDPLVHTARGILILALVLGSLGADAAASSGYGSVGHASASQPAGNIRLAVSAYTKSSGDMIPASWMY